MKSENAGSKKIKIQYYRSAIGSLYKHRRVLKGLGLRKLNQIVERPDVPTVRQMVKKISYLVRIIED